MAFQISCPNCGLRPVWELHYGGPVPERKAEAPDPSRWAAELYEKPNIAGEQVEWWYHRSGCKSWFIVRRDTRTNQVLETQWYESFAAQEAARAERG